MPPSFLRRRRTAGAPPTLGQASHPEQPLAGEAVRRALLFDQFQQARRHLGREQLAQRRRQVRHPRRVEHPVAQHPLPYLPRPKPRLPALPQPPLEVGEGMIEDPEALGWVHVRIVPRAYAGLMGCPPVPYPAASVASPSAPETSVDSDAAPRE